MLASSQIVAWSPKGAGHHPMNTAANIIKNAIHAYRLAGFTALGSSPWFAAVLRVKWKWAMEGKHLAHADLSPAPPGY